MIHYWLQCYREKLPGGAKSDKTVENRIARFLMNKSDGKRNIVEGDDGFASQKKNDKIDLRKIKRTVYVRNESSDNEETDVRAMKNFDFIFNF